MTNLREKFFTLLQSSSKPLLADGAMGTVLHARGVGFDRSFDELNLTDPALVAEVHREYIEAGYQWVVDIDLAKFFDTVNHDRLMARMKADIADKRVLRVVNDYLKAGVMVKGVVIETAEGTPQGGPLSPLLSNIVLDELDRELEKRGHRFVRYADDCNIYVKSQRSAERVMESISRYIEKKLRLQVNKEKSAVGLAVKRQFLGFSFY